MNLIKSSLGGVFALGGMTLPLLAAAELTVGISVALPNQPGSTQLRRIDLSDDEIIQIILPGAAGDLPTIQTGGMQGSPTGRLTSDLVCMQLGETPTSAFDFFLNDVNNRPLLAADADSPAAPASVSLSGITGASISSSASSLDVTLAPDAQTYCFELPLETPSFTTNACVEQGVIFDSSFEALAVEEPPLGVGVKVTQLPVVDETGATLANLEYEIQVRNCSSTETLSNIQIRDLFPAEGSGEANTVEFDSAWDASGDGGPIASGSGYVRHKTTDAITLAPGQIRTYTASRPVASSVSGGELRLGAFVIATADSGPTVRSVSTVAAVSENQSPTISVVDSSPIVIDEDSDALTPTDWGATDADGVVDQLALLSRDTTLFTVVQPTLTYNPDGSADATGGSLVPIADASGSSNLRLRARDERGAISFIDIPVTINAVNDAPTFAIAEGLQNPITSTINVTGESLGLCNVPEDVGCSLNHNFDAGFLFDVTITGFVQNVSPGAGETGNTPVTLTIDSLVPSGFFEPGGSPQLIQVDATTYDLNYQLSGSLSSVESVDIRIEATDPESAMTPVIFTITQ